jgi:hypothetical protein
MFDRLPLEVLLHCLSYLSVEEKLECLTLKKFIYNAIQSSGVLYEFIIIERPEKFADMYTFFDKHKDLRKLVKKLHIIKTSLDVYSYMALPTMFPNMQDFRFENPYHPIRDYDEKEVNAAFSPWAKRLTSLREFGTPVATFSLLANNSCPQLQNLSLNIMGMDDEEKKFVLYDYLKNCPNLKVLDLKYVNTNLQHMEKIHEYLPNLKALSLTQVGIPEDNFKGIPEPAMTMESLLIDDCTFVDNMAKWLTYISQKYPNLKNLIIGKAEDMMAGNFFDENRYQKILVKLVTNLKNLEFYCTKCLKLTAGILNAMDKANIQLKKIELGLYGADESFKLLVKSKQINYLTSLTISGTSYENMAFRKKKKFVQDLGKFSKLKHLRINQSKEEVDGPESNRVPLDFILETVKLLESIQMDFLTLEVARKTQEPFKTNLKKLILEECSIEAMALKGQEDWKEESEEYLENLLPKTEIEYRQLDDTPEDEEYVHLFQI